MNLKKLFDLNQTNPDSKSRVKYILRDFKMIEIRNIELPLLDKLRQSTIPSFRFQ